MKKIISLILALVLVMGLAITANADATTITVKPIAVEGDPLPSGDLQKITYTAYKLMDASVNGTAVSYTIPADWYLKDELEDSGLFTMSLIPGENGGKYQVVPTDTFKSASNADALITALEGVTLQNGTPLAYDSTNKYHKGTVTPGYYLIKSSLGSKLVVDTANGDTVLYQKNSYPTVTKTSGNENRVSYGVGETVPFELTVTLPTTPVAEGIVIHDHSTKMSNFAYVSATNNGADVTAEITSYTGEKTEVCHNDCVHHFSIPADYINANLGDTVVISYTAKNGDINVMYNKAFLTIGGYKSVDSTVRISNNSIIVKKTDGNGAPLSGASFVLAKDVTTGEGENVASTRYYYTLVDGAIDWVTDINSALPVEATDGPMDGGDIYAAFYNIGAGNYIVIETVVPPGYNKAADQSVDHTDTNDNGDIASDTITVVNNSGSELPSTGGIGTTLFYVIGGLMMVCAVVLLVTKRRVS